MDPRTEYNEATDWLRALASVFMSEKLSYPQTPKPSVLPSALHINLDQCEHPFELCPKTRAFGLGCTAIGAAHAWVLVSSQTPTCQPVILGHSV
eukprot:4512544-Amphidinium_carterae.1